MTVSRTLVYTQNTDWKGGYPLYNEVFIRKIQGSYYLTTYSDGWKMETPGDASVEEAHKEARSHTWFFNNNRTEGCLPVSVFFPGYEQWEDVPAEIETTVKPMDVIPASPVTQPRRLFAYVSGKSLSIKRENRRRDYDLYQLTVASTTRLSRVLDKYEKTVELEPDLTATIYFHG